jgi:hypothetical protein
MTKFQAYLKSVHACPEAREWAGDRTAKQAWEECKRGDWLLWWAAKAGTDRKTLVRIACQIARTALPFVKKGEVRPLKAIETAEAWCVGKGTIADLRAAVAAADAAAADVGAAAFAAAAYAAGAAAADVVEAAYASESYAAAADVAEAASAAAIDAAEAAASKVVYAASKNAAKTPEYTCFAEPALYSTKWRKTRAAKLQEFAALVREAIPFPGISKVKKKVA